MEEKELEKALLEVGSRILNPPSSLDDLLHILDKAETLLCQVEQSPSQLLSAALNPTLKGLTSKKLLGHPDADVRVHVAACMSEITRITAPDAPFDDNIMKDIFKIIVESFEKLDDFDSLSFTKRVSILDIAAKVRSCVVMLDLECDGLLLAMFSHFLRTVSERHPEIVITSMETIMTLVIDESEDVSPDLLSSLLLSVKKESKEDARRLAEKVIGNCASKLKPCLVSAIQSVGGPLDSFSEIVGSLCPESSHLVNDVSNPDERPKGSEEVENSCRPDQICTENSSSEIKGREKSFDNMISGLEAKESRPEESASCGHDCLPDEKSRFKENAGRASYLSRPDQVNDVANSDERPEGSEEVDKSSNLSRPDKICFDKSSSEIKVREKVSDIMINGLNALESRPEELADRQRSCLLGKKKRLEDSTGRYSMLGGSNQVNGVGNPDKRPKGSEEVAKSSNFPRPEQICSDNSSSEIKGREKSSDIIIDGLKAEESRPEESVSHHSGCLPGKKNRLKDSTDSSSRLGGPVQVNDLTDCDEGRKGSEAVEKSSNFCVPEQICTDNFSREMKGREKSSDESFKTQESSPMELAGRHGGRLAGKRKRLKESADRPSGLVRPDQMNDTVSPDEQPKICSDNSSSEMKRAYKSSDGDIETQESRPEGSAGRRCSHQLGKRKRQKESADRHRELGGPDLVNDVPNPDERPEGSEQKFLNYSRHDHICTDNSSNEMRGIDKPSDHHIKAQESRPEESAGHRRGYLPGKKKRLKESLDRQSGQSGPDEMNDRANPDKQSKGSAEDEKFLKFSRSDQISIDNSSIEIKGMEESSNGHIVPPESGPEESAGHHRSHLQGKKKRLRESAERPRGLSGPDQICTDDFSSEKKKREKSLDITSKAEEGQREESARWQKNDMSNPDERLKGSEVVDKSLNSSRTFNSSSKMKGAEKSSDGIKAKESWPEELAGHHSGRLPGKRNRLKKSNEGPNGLSGSGQANDATDPDERPKGSEVVDKTLNSSRPVQIHPDNSSSKMNEVEKSSDIMNDGIKDKVIRPEESVSRRRGRPPGKKNRLKESADRPSRLGGPYQICTEDSSSEKKKGEKSSDTISKAEESGTEGSARRRGRPPVKKHELKESSNAPVRPSSNERKNSEKSPDINTKAKESLPEESGRQRGRPPTKKCELKESIDVPIRLSSSEKEKTEKSPDITSKAKEGGSEGSARRRGRPPTKKAELKESIDAPITLGSSAQSGVNEVESKDEASSSSKKRSRENTEGGIRYDSNVVGAKIKVWWPKDKQFYRGVIDSYDPTTMKHKVLYVDGDEEDLALKNEIFKFFKNSGLKGELTPVKRSNEEWKLSSSSSNGKQSGRGGESSSRRKEPRKSIASS